MSAKRLALDPTVRSPTDPLEESMSPFTYRVYVMKRMMFVSSLYFRLLNIQNPTAQELDRVNIRFKLAWNNGAMRLPAALSNWVWSDIDLNSVFQRYLKNAEQIPELASEVLAKAPSWMKYGDGKRMEQDIVSVFDSIAVS